MCQHGSLPNRALRLLPRYVILTLKRTPAAGAVSANRARTWRSGFRAFPGFFDGEMALTPLQLLKPKMEPPGSSRTSLWRCFMRYLLKPLTTDDRSTLPIMKESLERQSRTPVGRLIGFCAVGVMAISCTGAGESSSASAGGTSTGATGATRTGVTGDAGGAFPVGGRNASSATRAPGEVGAGGQTSATGVAEGGARSDGGSSSVAIGGASTGAIGNGGASAGGKATRGGAAATDVTIAKGGTATASGTTSKGSTTTIGGTASKGGTASTGGTTTGPTTATGGSVGTCPSTFSNPVIWEDLPDLEILRVDDTYYYTASTFHNSPGAPVLRSYDLVNWEYLSHSVPVLDFDASYDLTNGKRSYVNGIWASSLVYRKSNKTFYWYGCMHNVGGGAMFTATSPTGPWTKHKVSFCYYDVGLLVDDDDNMYAAYGNNAISVAQIDPDKFTQVKTQKILDTPSSVGGPLEGSHFLKKDDTYYVFSTQYANGEWVMKSTSGPFGPYELKSFAAKVPYAGAGSGASPHQGNVFNTQNGEWYYMGFNDSYPAGRIPVMAPVTWSSDGWPSVTLVGGKWGASYPFPKLPCGAGKVKSRYGKDSFASEALEPWWEWNHNPDNTKWSSGSGLTLETATVTTDPYAARNTLTRRMPGPTSTATIELDYASMKDGDVAGLAAWRDTSSFIAVKRSGSSDKVVLVTNATLDSSWNTSSKGTDGASASISGGKIWLRIKANIRTDSGGGTASFFYSTDGTTFTQLGSAFSMKKDWTYFLGYRYAILNYATAALGGSVKVASFDLVTP